MRPIDIGILIVVAILLLLALRSAIRHYTGKGGGCCGCSGGSCGSCGSDGNAGARGEDLSKKAVTAGTPSKIMRIEGMHCANCKKSVEKALTAQNGLGVTGIHAPEPEFVVLQLRAVLDGFPVHAAKTGMLFSAGIINALADALRDRSFPLVVDPVSVSQSGSRLLREDAVEALKERMIPGCDLLTPNRPEAEMLTGMTISCADDAAAAGEALIRMGAKAVLIKGGHMESSIVVTDCLCQAGQAPKFLPQPKVETNNNHGTGCTLSAAIATGLGHGLPLQVAVTRAQEFLNLALRKSYAPGKGCGPVNHAARR